MHPFDLHCVPLPPSLFQRFITQEGHKLELTPNVPAAVTNAVSWRKEGIRYRKNEVFLDVIESVNLLVSSGTLEVEACRVSTGQGR